MADTTDTIVPTRNPPPTRRRISRVTNACDLCKSRKVRCARRSGPVPLPCTYCAKRSHPCTFSTPRTRPSLLSEPWSTAATSSPTIPHDSSSSILPTAFSSSSHLPPPSPPRSFPHTVQSPTSPPSVNDENLDHAPGHDPDKNNDHDHDQSDTAVPLEAQLLRDTQGTAIFVGDCAPQSFLQTVRHLLSSEIKSGDEALSETTRASVVELGFSSNRESGTVPTAANGDSQVSFTVEPEEVGGLVEGFLVAAAGLAYLFEGGREKLSERVREWSDGKGETTGDVEGTVAVVYFLVLAIGAQERRGQEARAERWFLHARDVLMGGMCAAMNTASVKGFALVALYMLRAGQANGAYLYFSLAARTAYAIGLHRSEVNASFGRVVQKERDCIWKSLRILDMVVSNLLGRPPSTSDVDCTVKYTALDDGVTRARQHSLDTIDASVGIFMIFERIVVEVYSRKRISLRIANYISHQLKTWASTWLEPLSKILSKDTAPLSEIAAACCILCSYYNCIMLLTRPFLIYDIYAHLGAPLRASDSRADDQAKREYADAAIDAAISCVQTVQSLADDGMLPFRMPLVVSWLFTTSLVLAIGIVGRHASSLESHCAASVRCLSQFAEADLHARQYVKTTESLLDIITRHVHTRQVRQHEDRKRASSKLFGLHVSNPTRRPRTSAVQSASGDNVGNTTVTPELSVNTASSNLLPLPEWNIYDADFFALPGINDSDAALQDFLQPGRQTLEGMFADVPLFPMYDQV